MKSQSFTPVVHELPSSLTPAHAGECLKHLPYLLILESVVRHPERGRYSFVAADPVMLATPPQNSREPWQVVQEQLACWATVDQPDLPPFQGGWAGCLTYELGNSFETLPALPPAIDDLPAAWLGLYDVVLAWDHLQDRVWLISQGCGENLNERCAQSQIRASQFLELMSRTDSVRSPMADQSSPARPPLPSGFVQLAENLWSNFSAGEYQQAVARAVEYIRAGDIFQTNLAQQLMVPATMTSCDLYRTLRQHNPSPFAGYFDMGNCQVISSSPERLVACRQGHLETRPIKGTRRRTGAAALDEQLAAELQNNAKDRAENTMIVDLMRNDFSRICRDDSVQITQWCQLETYASVLHLVSAVEGTLLPEVQLTDVLSALFPGGSVTGAPKIRAMEIIAELERFQRGPYCGSLGYLGLNGACDWNILIRTVTAQRGWWQIPVGGAVVFDSIPWDEYEETWVKAAAILRACGASWPTSLGTIERSCKPVCDKAKVPSV